MTDLFRNPWVVIGVITAVLIGGSVWFSTAAAERYNEGVVVQEFNIKGNPEAAVVLTEYSDFQCPACAAFQPVVSELVDTYGDMLRFEYKHFPLIQIHPQAEPAARAAEAAGQQGKFFEFHDMLFENQSEWAASPTPGAFFVRYAEELGLDIDQFTRQQRSSLLRDRVRSDFNEARELGLTGTPTFFLNGERMQIETYEDFIRQIESALGVTPLENSTTESDGVTISPEPIIEFGI